MFPPSRRAVLAGAMATAATVSAAASPVAAAGGDDLARLIEQHRTARAAFNNAIDRYETIKDAYDETGHKTTILVPTSYGVSYELRLGYEEIERLIAIEYDAQRRKLAFLSKIAPDLAEQSRGAIDAKEVEDRAVLDRMFAEEDARQEAFGLAAADQAYNAGHEAEEAALLALCRYRCATLAEARVKADYLAEYRLELLDEHVVALIGSFRAEA